MKSLFFSLKFLCMSFLAIQLASCSPGEEDIEETDIEIIDENSSEEEPIEVDPCQSAPDIVLNRIGEDITIPFESGGFGSTIALNGDGRRIVIGSPWADRMGPASGKVSVYEFRDNVWQQLGNDIIGRADQEWTGYNVTINEEGDIIGTSGKACRIYQFNGIDWVQLGGDITTPDGEKGSNFGGLDMDSSGIRIAVGTSSYEPTDNGLKRGGVRIFEFSEGEWKRFGPTLWLEGAFNSLYAGRKNEVSISADGNRVALGASYRPPNSVRYNYVGVFEYFNSSWDRISLTGGRGTTQSSRVALNSDGTRMTRTSLANGWTGSVHLLNVGAETTTLGSGYGNSNTSFYGLSHSINGDGNRLIVYEPIISANGGTNNGNARLFFQVENTICQVLEPISGDLMINNEYSSTWDFGQVSISSNGNFIAMSSPNIVGDTFDGIVKVYEIIEE